MRALLLTLALVTTATASAQWDIQTPVTTADLRGIASVDGSVAWASGSNGTVLRTEDAGYLWQHCITPPGAEHLDFRGIQALDANTAIVMSSGKGDMSRLYKTTDGCQSWKLLFTNPEIDGFWDAIKYVAGDELVILGDSVNGKKELWEWGGEDTDSFHKMTLSGGSADKNESSFAASNSVLELPVFPMFDANPQLEVRWASGTPEDAYMNLVPVNCHCRYQPAVTRVDVPVQIGTQSSGIFSFDFRNSVIGVAVGGDFEHPQVMQKTAACSSDGGKTWLPATTPPHGYRSAVVYNRTAKTWITVGPNGTDISTDDGRNWHPPHPRPDTRRRPALERPLAALRRRPPRPHRPAQSLGTASTKARRKVRKVKTPSFATYYFAKLSSLSALCVSLSFPAALAPTR